VTSATLTRGRTSRRLLPLGLVFLAVGLAVAFVGPFQALFLDTAVHAGPLQVTLFLVAAPASGVLASHLIGRLSDRRPIRRPLLIAASVAGLVGTGLTAVVRDFWVLLALTVTVTAVAWSLYPQTFAYARQVLQRDDPGRAAFGITTLRTVFSLAWVAGPPLATVLLRAGDFRYLYGAAAVMYALAALVAYRSLPGAEPPDRAPRPAPAPSAVGPPPPRSIPLIVGAFTLLQTPLILGAQALPLFITHDLGGRISDAGLLLGLCAALEIPLMLGLGLLTTRLPVRRLILLGAGCGVAYQALVAATPYVWPMFVGQLLNALFIAGVSGLGISYVQDLMPTQPGRATTMFTNTFPVGQMLAGPLFGLAQLFGYRLAYGINLALCALGLALLAWAGRRQR
jgi:MFS transporter, SET family, sugar efflux transporter